MQLVFIRTTILQDLVGLRKFPFPHLTYLTHLTHLTLIAACRAGFISGSTVTLWLSVPFPAPAPPRAKSATQVEPSPDASEKTEWPSSECTGRAPCSTK